MLYHKITFRVRYAETDQMKYVYHGNYAEYLEMGRTEWLRNLGISYKSIEDSGIMLPVVNLNINYLKPARYDNLLTLKTFLKKFTGVKIIFGYEIYDEKNNLLTTATSTLVFINKEKGKPTKAPDYIFKKIDFV